MPLPRERYRDEYQGGSARKAEIAGKIKRLFDIVGQDNGAVGVNAASFPTGLASAACEIGKSAPWAHALPRRRGAAASLKQMKMMV